jgi:pimeloyl-ACP methyl ester carboxylesterase
MPYVLALIGAILAYGLATWALARRFLLDDAPVENLLVELDRPGHHIGLSHHPAAERRFATPLILCHGLGANRFNMDFKEDGKGQDRLSLARYLAKAGFDVWVLELRGSGRAKVPLGAEYNADEQALEDLPLAIETVLELSGAEKITWVGHSWGGLLAYLFLASDHPLKSKVESLVAIASPGSVQHHRVPRAFVRFGHFSANRKRALPLVRYARLGLAISPMLVVGSRLFYPRLAKMPGPMFRRLLASLAENINSGQIRQMLYWHQKGELVSMSGESYEARFKEIEQPMLLLASPFDYLAPPSSVESVARRVGSKDVTFKVMSKQEGYTADFGHGGLLISEEAPDEVFPVIKDWLVARAKPQSS